MPRQKLPRNLDSKGIFFRTTAEIRKKLRLITTELDISQTEFLEQVINEKTVELRGKGKLAYFQPGVPQLSASVFKPDKKK